MRCWAPRSSGCEQTAQPTMPTGGVGRSCVNIFEDTADDLGGNQGGGDAGDS